MDYDKVIAALREKKFFSEKFDIGNEFGIVEISILDPKEPPNTNNWSVAYDIPDVVGSLLLPRNNNSGSLYFIDENICVLAHNLTDDWNHASIVWKGGDSFFVRKKEAIHDLSHPKLSNSVRNIVAYLNREIEKAKLAVDARNGRLDLRNKIIRNFLNS